MHCSTFFERAFVSGHCVDHGYTPQNGSRTPYPLAGNIYFPDSVIRYSCDRYFVLANNETLQRCSYNGSDFDWSPKALPSCVECECFVLQGIVESTNQPFLNGS